MEARLKRAGSFRCLWRVFLVIYHGELCLVNVSWKGTNTYSCQIFPCAIGIYFAEPKSSLLLSLLLSVGESAADIVFREKRSHSVARAQKWTKKATGGRRRVYRAYCCLARARARASPRKYNNNKERRQKNTDSAASESRVFKCTRAAIDFHWRFTAGALSVLCTYLYPRVYYNDNNNTLCT